MLETTKLTLVFLSIQYSEFSLSVLKFRILTVSILLLFERFFCYSVSLWACQSVSIIVLARFSYSYALIAGES